jgi:hypothetical protein
MLARRRGASELRAECPFRVIPFVVEMTEHSNSNKEDAMKYLLQIYEAPASTGPDTPTEAERNSIYGEYVAIAEAPGVLGSDQLQPPETATTVRVQDGRTLTTDGPFAETKEAFGGYYLYEAENLDAAIELAARIPAARLGGAIEVRPVVER